MRESSNVTAHRLELFYEAGQNLQLSWTGIISRPLNGAGQSAEPFTARLQFEVMYFPGTPPRGRKRK